MRRLGFLLLLLASTLTGCTLSSQKNIDSLANSSGFKRLLVKGDNFEHVVWLNKPAHSGNSLHVYLEGDGSPWIRHTWIASDPTPENPLMLQLMQMDSARSIYLGRPCYFGLANQPPCEARYWTSARYSEDVVLSMQRALERIIEQEGVASLCLWGTAVAEHWPCCSPNG